MEIKKGRILVCFTQRKINKGAPCGGANISCTHRAARHLKYLRQKSHLYSGEHKFRDPGFGGPIYECS